MTSSTPDWGRLRVFFHVFRAGSVTAAAAELHVTQSAVSQSLAKLEQELGAQLFVRRHRRLVPTPAATRLHAMVEPFVAALDEGLPAIHRAQHELRGVLRLGAPAELGAHRLPPVLAAFRRDNPGVSFELVLGPPSELLPRLDEGRLELALVDVFEPLGARMAGLEVVEVMEEPLVLVGERGYEAARLGGNRTLRRLAAVWAHRALYVLMILVPALGASAWYLGIEEAGDLHELTMNIMMIIAGVHALGALFHQFVLKDGLLRRMTP